MILDLQQYQANPSLSTLATSIIESFRITLTKATADMEADTTATQYVDLLFRALDHTEHYWSASCAAMITNIPPPTPPPPAQNRSARQTDLPPFRQPEPQQTYLKYFSDDGNFATKKPANIMREIGQLDTVKDLVEASKTFQRGR